MEEKLIEYADQIIEALKAGVDFAGEQAPILIQEILTYYTIYHAAGMIIFLVIIGLCVYGVNYIILNSENEKSYWQRRKGFGNDNEHRIFSFSILSIVTFLATIAFISNFFDLIKVIIAPRLYIIEKLTSLL